MDNEARKLIPGRDIVRMYPRKPQTYAIIQWTGENFVAIDHHCEGAAHITDMGNLVVKTNHGETLLTVGDYIIKGATDIYPCTPMTLKMTYGDPV